MVIGIDASRAFVPERTGTENYSYEMIRALATLESRHRFILYLRPEYDSELLSNLCLPENFTIKELSWSRLWTQCALAMSTWFDSLDVLWVPAHTLPIAGNLRLPMVVTLHGIEYAHLPGAYAFGQNLHLTWSTQWAVMRSQKIIAVSEKTKEDLIAWLGTKSDKICVIHEGVDLERFSSIRSAARINAKKRVETMSDPYVLFVGTVQPRKNLIRLIEAFALMLKNKQLRQTFSSVMDNLRLIIAGKMGWEYQDILAKPRELEISEKVVFLGYVPDSRLPELYRNALAYIEPSLQEGFGLPVLEAMASGVPVVVANAGALPEVAGNAALFVDPESVESIAMGLAVVCGFDGVDSDLVLTPPGIDVDVGVREMLISRGLMRAQEFGWGSAAQKLLKEIESVS